MWTVEATHLKILKLPYFLLLMKVLIIVMKAQTAVQSLMMNLLALMLIAILMRKVRVTGQSLRVNMLVVMLAARFLKRQAMLMQAISATSEKLKVNLVCLTAVSFFENDLWKDPCKNMCVTKLPGNPKSCEIFLDSRFKGSISEDLLESVGASKDHKLTKLRSFIAACFEAPVFGSTGSHEYLQCDRPGNPYPQFSCSKSSSSITCEICVPYLIWAFENKISHASRRSKGATLDKILNNAFTPSFSGLRQVYEHSISKSHLEAIAFLECCEKNIKSVKSKENVLSNSHCIVFFFPSKNSEAVPLN